MIEEEFRRSRAPITDGQLLAIRNRMMMVMRRHGGAHRMFRGSDRMVFRVSDWMIGGGSDPLFRSSHRVLFRPFGMAFIPIGMIGLDPFRIVLMPPFGAMPMMLLVVCAAVSVSFPIDMGMRLEEMIQVGMARQVPRVVHEAGIGLKLRMTVYVLLEILLRSLRERRRPRDCAKQCGGRDDRANLHFFVLLLN